MTPLMIAYIIVLIVLIFLSMFFSSADMVYGSVSLSRMERRVNEHPNSKRRKRAYQLSKNYDKTISTILLFNDTINAGIDTIATLLGIEVAINLFFENNSAVQETYGLVFSMIFLVFKIIIGEIIAKSVGKIYNYKFSSLYSFIIKVCYIITFPITFLVGGFGNIITYPITRKFKDVQIQDDELHEMIDEGEEEGLIDEDKAELLRGAVDYASTEIYEIMTPRAKIYAVEKSDSLSSIFEDSKIFTYSRIPVYEENIDNIIGFIRTKTLIRLKLEGKVDSIESIIEPISFFPRTKEINDLLTYFHQNKVQIAVVLDEYGGTEGIITREDIIEELVGEIWDETDQPNEPYVERNDGGYIVDGGMNLEDFCDLFEINFDEIETEYVTIGGFIIELLDDKFANKDDTIKWQNLDMTIIALGKHHTVKKILVYKEENQDEEDD